MSGGRIARGWRVDGRLLDLVWALLGGGGRALVWRAGLAGLAVALGGSRRQFGHSCAAVASQVARHPASVRRWMAVAAKAGWVDRERRGSVRRRLTTLVTVKVQLPAGAKKPGPTVGLLLDAVKRCGLSGVVAALALWAEPELSGRELGDRLGFGPSWGCLLAARLRGLVQKDRAAWAERGKTDYDNRTGKPRAKPERGGRRGRPAEADPREATAAAAWGGKDPPKSEPPTDAERASGREHIDKIKRERGWPG